MGGGDSFTPEAPDCHPCSLPCPKGRLDVPSTPGQCEIRRWGRIAQWNLGGQSVQLLDVTAKDIDILCVPEVSRDDPGWGEFESEHFQWITHRAKTQWRGVGIGIATDKFDCVVKKISCNRGIWALVRIHGLGRVVCGSLHAHTGTTNAVYQAAVHEFFGALPSGWRQYPLLCGIDANETPKWIEGDNDRLEIGHCSTNLNALLHEALQSGCQPLPPGKDQRLAPSHFPRDEARQGRQIDFILWRHITIDKVIIDAERRHCIGSDHALLHATLSSAGKSRMRWGNDSRARWVVSDLPPRVIVDDEDISQMAKDFTRPKRTTVFVDDQETRDAIRRARASGASFDWKLVHKLRHKARSRWKAERLQRVLGGSWDDFRQLQNDKKRKRGWWGGMLAGKSAAELTAEVQIHLEGKMVDPRMQNWETELETLIDSVDLGGDFVEFSILDLRTELQGMRCKSAVGPDGIGVHLLRVMASHDELGPQLLSLTNHIVKTQAIPASWNTSFLALLAKVDKPTKASDLRPISVSSAFNKLVNRLVCVRALPMMRRGSRVSACGKGRQAADVIGAISRVRDVTHEWKLAALVCKLDVAGAFDRIDRHKVAGLLVNRLKDHRLGCELKYLLTQLRVHRLLGKVPGGHDILFFLLIAASSREPLRVLKCLVW